jgi:hypothetical protein
MLFFFKKTSKVLLILFIHENPQGNEGNYFPVIVVVTGGSVNELIIGILINGNNIRVFHVRTLKSEK